jgi:hypothetical protein
MVLLQEQVTNVPGPFFAEDDSFNMLSIYAETLQVLDSVDITLPSLFYYFIKIHSNAILTNI